MPFDPNLADKEMNLKSGFNPDLADKEMGLAQQAPGPLTAAATPTTPLTAQDARTAFGQPPPPKWTDVIGRQIAETGAHILKSPYSPGTEIAGEAMAQINQLMRPQQTLGQNIAAGAINLAPYFTPIAGQALFARDIVTDPSIVPELAKEIGRTYRDVVMDPKEFAGQLREAPVEKTLALAGPILAMLGIRAVGKGIGAKVKTTRAVSEQIARGPEARALEMPKVKESVLEQTRITPKEQVKEVGDKKLSALEQTKPKAEKETLVAPVIEADGKIFKGKTHSEAIDKAISEKYVKRDSDGYLVDRQGNDIVFNGKIDLFETSKGRIINRFEASKKFGITSGEGLLKKQPPKPTLPEKIAIAQEPSKAARGKPTVPSTDDIFIRKAKKNEQGLVRSRAIAQIPTKEGYEAVYKPYGNTGERADAGFYYTKSKPPKPFTSKVESKPPDLKPPAKPKPPIELQAGLTPKVVAETVRKTIPDFIKQLRHRFKTEAGKSLVKDVETADTKWRRRQGQQIEKFRQAGIYKGTLFRKGGLKSQAQREGLADALEGLKTDNAKLIPDEMVKTGKRIFDEMYYKAKAVGVDVTGYRKKYFPRVMKHEVGEIIFNDLKSKSQKFKELINLNQTDQVLIDLVERLADSKQFKPKTIEALKHLIKTGQAKNYGEAFRLLREQSTGDMFRPFGNLEKPRTIELPKEYYERDALKIISRYTDSWAQRLAEIEIWGKDGSKAIKKFNEIQKINPEEAKLAETMVDIWSGEYEKTQGLTGSLRKFVDDMTSFQFGTKIGLGTATIPNTTQMLISVIVAAGPYRFAKGIPAVLKARGRSWIRSSGSTIVTAMKTMAGYEPGGVMGKVADRLGKTSLFHGVNKLNQYLAAATGDVFIKDLYRIYNTTKFGKRKAWAKSWLDKFNVDPSKKLTENIRQEAMYRFATDTQLQKNILNDALFFNTAYGRPLALFKRFGFRQAVWIKDVVFKQELIGNKNPLPLLRLVAGGIIGGEFVIWAKNNIRQFLSGEPVYRKDDDIWERVLNDLAAVGSAGVLTDIISSDNYASSLKFAATPVYVSDAIKAYQVLEQTELDRRKYDDWAIVALRTPSRAGQFFGSLPKYLTKRLQTTGQQKGRLRFFKGRERTEIINLILDRKGEQAGKRWALWNQNYPHSPIEIGFDDIKRKIISKTKF